MSDFHIPHLRATLRDILRDAINHEEMMAEATGEEIHIAIRNEYEAGLTILDTLVDPQGRFIDDEARNTVRETLDCVLGGIPDEFPLKRRRVLALIQQIDAAEKAVVGDDTMAA